MVKGARPASWPPCESPPITRPPRPAAKPSVGLWPSVTVARFRGLEPLHDGAYSTIRVANQITTDDWSIPDPAAAGDTDEATYAAFQRVAADLEIRVSHLIARMSTPKED
jgi:hypothetical protein